VQLDGTHDDTYNTADAPHEVDLSARALVTVIEPRRGLRA